MSEIDEVFIALGITYFPLYIRTKKRASEISVARVRYVSI